MKNKISFLAIISCALCVGYANASECVGEDCELEPIVIEQNFGPMSFVDLKGYTKQPEAKEVETQEIILCDSTASIETCYYDYSCPFDTIAECDIWRKKPEHKTYSGPRSAHFSDFRVDEILHTLYSDYDTDANNEHMSALVERYKILTRASNACCGAGIMYKMRENGASDEDIYKFLQDDANYFAIIKRCMMTPNDELLESYSYGVNAQMVADVRNACLCKNRPWFENLLQPFNDMYERMPFFHDNPFLYSYVDDMQRDITVSVNEDVQNTMGLLSECPK